ncbi:MAG: hypothetical protein WBV61_12335 [Rhodanobacteraceae bacterium]
MKLLLSMALVGMVLALSACATGTSNLRGGPQDQELDSGKIAAVNQWAEIKGATVLWIHYPTRTKEQTGVNR